MEQCTLWIFQFPNNFIQYVELHFNAMGAMRKCLDAADNHERNK